MPKKADTTSAAQRHPETCELTRTERFDLRRPSRLADSLAGRSCVCLFARLFRAVRRLAGSAASGPGAAGREPARPGAGHDRRIQQERAGPTLLLAQEARGRTRFL